MNEGDVERRPGVRLRIYKDLHRQDSKVSVRLTEFDQRRRIDARANASSTPLAIERTSALRDT